MLTDGSLLDVVKLGPEDGFLGSGENGGEVFLLYVNGNIDNINGFGFDESSGLLRVRDLESNEIVLLQPPQESAQGRDKLQPSGSWSGAARAVGCAGLANRIASPLSKIVHSKYPSIDERFAYTVIFTAALYACVNAHLPHIENVDLDNHWRAEKQFKGGLR